LLEQEVLFTGFGGLKTDVGKIWSVLGVYTPLKCRNWKEGAAPSVFCV